MYLDTEWIYTLPHSRKGTCNSVGMVGKAQRSNGDKREEASDKLSKAAMSSGHI